MATFANASEQTKYATSSCAGAKRPAGTSTSTGTLDVLASSRQRGTKTTVGERPGPDALRELLQLHPAGGHLVAQAAKGLARVPVRTAREPVETGANLGESRLRPRAQLFAQAAAFGVARLHQPPAGGRHVAHVLSYVGL